MLGFDSGLGVESDSVSTFNVQRLQYLPLTVVLLREEASYHLSSVQIHLT